jgi:hypothetical protein
MECGGGRVRRGGMIEVVMVVVMVIEMVMRHATSPQR